MTDEEERQRRYGCIRKKVYTDHKKATRFAAERGMQVYQCHYCGLFHLTAQGLNARPKPGD